MRGRHADGGGDFGKLTPERQKMAEAVGVTVKGADDIRGMRQAMEVSGGCCINFLMCDQTWENGPVRQIPGTHTSMQPVPKPSEEPAWMRMSTLVGAPAGAGILRDGRAWHGKCCR